MVGKKKADIYYMYVRNESFYHVVCVCLPVRLSVSVCLSTHLSVCLSICLSVHLSVGLHVHVCLPLSAGGVYKGEELPECILEIKEYCLRHVREMKTERKEKERLVQ